MIFFEVEKKTLFFFFYTLKLDIVVDLQGKTMQVGF